MSKKTYMLDTNICSFIMRERPDAVLAKLEQAVTNQHRIVVSAITYSEMRFGAANPKASPKVAAMVDAFIQRLDAILSWDAAAVSGPLAQARHQQGWLLGRMAGLGFSLRAETVVYALTQDVLKSSEIEGEILDVAQVRSSVARRPRQTNPPRIKLCRCRWR